jgi:hypothetical protein
MHIKKCLSTALDIFLCTRSDDEPLVPRCQEEVQSSYPTNASPAACALISMHIKQYMSTVWTFSCRRGQMIHPGGHVSKRKSRADIPFSHQPFEFAFICMPVEFALIYMHVKPCLSTVWTFSCRRDQMIHPGGHVGKRKSRADIERKLSRCCDKLREANSTQTKQTQRELNDPIFTPTIRICIYLHASRICIDLHACEAMFEHCLDFLLSTRSEDQSLRPRSQDRYWDLMI